jgi:L-ribulose-5-phosphate 3-epimerase
MANPLFYEPVKLPRFYRNRYAISMLRRSFLVSSTLLATRPKSTAICLFSKHLQWLSAEDAISAAKQMGFDGLDLTVRPGGHVEPAQALDQLPALQEKAKQQGIAIPMITTVIRDARSPQAENIVKACLRAGIKHYRWAGFTWANDQSLPDQLADFSLKVQELAALNRSYGVTAVYHNHSGPQYVGSAIWDLWQLLKDHSPQDVAINFDLAHATVEGGLGGWRNSMRLMQPYIQATAIKDFYWQRGKDGKWRVRWCPLGQGMVNIKEYLLFLKNIGFSGPIQLHAEYDELGPAAHGRGLPDPQSGTPRQANRSATSARAGSASPTQTELIDSYRVMSLLSKDLASLKSLLP